MSQLLQCQFCGSLFTPLEGRVPSQTCERCWLEIEAKTTLRELSPCGLCGRTVRGFAKWCGICGADLCADSNCWSQHYAGCEYRYRFNVVGPDEE